MQHKERMKYQLHECMGSRVRVISRKMDSIYRRNLGDAGVTENQLSILMALYKTGEIEQKKIGELLNLEKSSLSRNLIRLIASNFVIKSGRVNRPMIELTSEGKQKVEELIPAWEKAMNEIHSVLDREDIRAFQKIERSITDL